MFNTITTHVLRHVKRTEYYRARFSQWDGHPGSQICCPFHDDKTPSFSVNIGVKGGCFCQAASCRKRIGSIIHLEKELCNLQTDKEAARKIYSEFIRPVIEFEAEFGLLITKFQDDLKVCASDLYPILEKELGFNQKTIDEFHIGWCFENHRFTFPVFNEWGDLINIRYYRAPSQRTKATKFKIINHTGFGSSSIFPLNLLEKLPNRKVLYWLKAERDVILAWSLGIPAFCLTGGESEAIEKYFDYLTRLDCKVILCGDNDAAGKLALEARWNSLLNTKIPFAKVEIPEPSKYKDFSEWILGGKKTAHDFYLLPEIQGNSSPLEVKPIERFDLPEGMEDFTLNLLEGDYEVSDIGHKQQLLNSAITVHGIVTAKMDHTFSVPHVIECGGKLYRIPISRELLSLVNTSDDGVQKRLQSLLNTNLEVKYRQFITISEIEIIPVLVPGKDAIYVKQTCFFFGEKIECNIPYRMLVIPTSSMKRQETVGLVYDAVPISNVLDEYVLSNDDVVALQERFGMSDNASGAERYIALEDLANELSTRHTLIHNRTDLHIVQLLTWCSPIQFNFHSDGLQRGWMNTLILGDSQTGKSQIAQALRSLFECGVFVSTENCTFVGLVGGAVKASSGNFMLRWGKIPLYNRQLVVLEELSGLDCNEISNMSDVRSSGIARLDKGGLTGETSAKTRLMCLSNVRRKHSNLGDYAFGVRAVQELIGQNEDISRFDLILTVTDNEVSNEIINQNRLHITNNHYDKNERALFRKLIIFIWSLQAEQIEFTPEAYGETLKLTLEFSKIYHSSIPVFKGGSGRYKIARIACAIAALQFSWDANRGHLIILPSHVQAAAKLLRRLYNKASLGYGKYSKQQYYMESIIEEDRLIRNIQVVFTKKDSEQNFYEYLLANGQFEKEELNQSLNLGGSVLVDRLISTMLSSHLIRRQPNNPRLVWEVTYQGRVWLEKKHL